MSTPYDELVASGAVGSLKRDTLVEAASDVFYLVHISKWFREEGGAKAAEQASECAARVVNDLVANGLCSLATWGEQGTAQPVTKHAGEVRRLVERYESPESMPFDFFLVATEKGKQWTSRYEALVDEL